MLPNVLGQETGSQPPAGSRRRWLAWGVLAALLGAMALHVWGAREELASVQRLSIVVLLATCALQFASQLFLNAALLLPLRTCISNIGFWELYLVRTGGVFLGALVPVAGGLAVRLAYLRSRGLTYADFAWATLLSNVLALSAAATLGVAATGVLWAVSNRPPAPVLAVSVGILAASVAISTLFELLPRLPRHSWLRRWSWLSSMVSLKSTRSLAARVFSLSLGRHVVSFVSFGLLYQSLSPMNAGFLSGGLVYALTSPVRMVTLTPGNLGISEWLVAVVGKMLSFDLTTGLIVALAFRGSALLAQALGAAMAASLLARRARP